MMLFEQIEKKKSMVPETIEDIKKSYLPLVLLGAGDRARCVFKYLRTCQILIHAVVVNKAYYKENQTIWIEDQVYLPVQCLEDILEKYERINVILGFSKYLLPDKFFLNPQVEKVYSINIGLTKDYNFPYEFFAENKEILEKLYTKLEDELSRELLVAHINGRIQGIDIKAKPAKWSDPQYFLPDLMEWRECECVMDCGAYVGDTAEEFIHKIPGTACDDYKIYCWEPEEENYLKLKENFKNNKRVIPLKYGTFSEKTELFFEMGNGESSAITTSGNLLIETETIDRIAQNEVVTFIKMDIEGSELNALYGARQTIVRDKPRLAICLYHKQEDLMTIPQYIESLMPDYKMYIRSHSTMPSELVLFCV